MFKNNFNFVGEMRRKIVLLFAAFLISNSLLYGHAEHFDFYRSLGKMYVVLGVVLILFLGIVLFLVHLQKQVSKLEKQFDNERS